MLTYRKRVEQLSSNTQSIIIEEDISCALILLKKRHRLSISCINDMISLLRTLKVPNVPLSWYHLKNKLIAAYTPPTKMFICPNCQEASISGAACFQCSKNFTDTAKPKYFLSFPIHNQIERVLQYNEDVFPTRRSRTRSMKDIRDGAVHQKLQHEIQQPFLSITVNVDGVQPRKGSQQAIWPILIIINEIPLKKRYATENIILAGVWPRPSKPTRTEMSQFFRPVVEELITLERGVTFSFHHDDGNMSVTARVFLIGACCDKPAQSLFQFLSEPTAEYECGRCEIPGMSFISRK